MTAQNQPPPPHQQQSPALLQPEEVHLNDYLAVLKRRKVTLLITFLAIFVGVAIYTFLTQPTYEASATLFIKDSTSNQGILGDLMVSNANPMNAEIEIVRSRSIAEQVVKQLHLNWAVKSGNGTGCRILAFDSSDPQPIYKLRLTGNGTYELSDHGGKVLGQGNVGQPFTTQNLNLVVEELTGKVGDSVTLELLPFNATVRSLNGRVKASEVGARTNILRIAFTDTSPRRAAEVVNALVQAYLAQTVIFNTEEASRTVDFVDNQLNVAQKELEKAEGDLQSFKSEAGVVKLDTEAEALIDSLSAMERERAGAALQKKLVEFALASLKESVRNGTPYSPAVMKEDPLVASLAGKMVDLETQKQSLLTEFTKDHPQVKALQHQINELQDKIRATYETSLRNLARQEADLGSQLNQYEQVLKRMPATERDLARHMRQAKVNADIYTFLLQKQQEARIVQAATISNIKIIDPAIQPDSPIKPNKRKNLLLGLVLGLMLGIGLAFFHDYMDDTIKDAEEAKRLLGWPLLGQIPRISTIRKGGTHTTSDLICHLAPKSVAAEAFRSIRTGLHYVSARRRNKVIMITSCFPGEGKSTFSSNLAITLTQTGSRVLLVGCDMRLPSLHEIFSIPNSPGLTEVLVGDATLDQAIRQTGIGKLDCLCAGVIPPNPAELLGSDQMTKLVRDQLDNYEYIILDAPPVLAVSDSPILATLCDSIVMIMEAGRVPAKAATYMREILTRIEAPVSGFVFNDKSGHGENSGYYGRNSGYHGYTDELGDTQKSAWWKRMIRR